MRRPLIAFSLAALALIASLALSSTAMAAPKTTVTLGDSFFAPSSKTIARGAKVRFKWIGVKRHNVKKTRGPGAGFKSRTTRARGVNYAKRFTKRGTYRLVCTIHPETMRLKLTVR